jgi:diaminopimelate epimerase
VKKASTSFDDLENRLLFTKYVATGNDFIFIDALEQIPAPFSDRPRTEVAKALCERNWGVGADGLVFVEKGAHQGRFSWDFYNSDGSRAEMCGNASRCMGLWASRALGLDSIEFETAAGVVRAEIKAQTVASWLDYVAIDFKRLNFEVDDRIREAWLVNTGVPHAVVKIDRIYEARAALDVVKALRFHGDTGKAGANVTFFEAVAEDRFATVTFERGVEGFTLSCGTGVLAAAAVGLRESEAREAWVTTPGGELKVKFGNDWSGALLEGPASYVFEATVDESFFSKR